MNIEFKFEVGEFVVRRSPHDGHEATPWNIAERAPIIVVARTAVDEGSGFVIQYHTRNGREIDVLRDFELESWDVYAVRNKLMERNSFKSVSGAEVGVTAYAVGGSRTIT